MLQNIYIVAQVWDYLFYTSFLYEMFKIADLWGFGANCNITSLRILEQSNKYGFNTVSYNIFLKTETWLMNQFEYRDYEFLVKSNRLKPSCEAPDYWDYE